MGEDQYDETTLAPDVDDALYAAEHAIDRLINAAQEHTTTSTKDMTAAIRDGRSAQRLIYRATA
jgi:N-acetylglucosamine-6-phosphate deacetylase